MKTILRTALPSMLLILFTAALPAADKKLMHCFYFTPIESASQADWDAFYKATDALPGKIPGLTRVWHGKLRRPATQFAKDGTSRVRTHGVCMEMNDEAALKTYASHPAHSEWDAAYSKVRQPGTMTFDLVGQ